MKIKPTERRKTTDVALILINVQITTIQICAHVEQAIFVHTLFFIYLLLYLVQVLFLEMTNNRAHFEELHFFKYHK
jgi:hypothetical protein